MNWSIHAWLAKTLGTIHCDRRLVAGWKYLPKKMYCSGVGHGLSTLEHMGCFISELDVCARWQVAWRGGEETRGGETEGEFYVAISIGKLLFYINIYVFLSPARASVSDAVSVYPPLEVNQAEPRRNFLMEMLSQLRHVRRRANYFIGSNHSQGPSCHFSPPTCNTPQSAGPHRSC